MVVCVGSRRCRLSASETADKSFGASRTPFGSSFGVCLCGGGGGSLLGCGPGGCLCGGGGASEGGAGPWLKFTLPSRSLATAIGAVLNMSGAGRCKGSFFASCKLAALRLLRGPRDGANSGGRGGKAGVLPLGRRDEPLESARVGTFGICNSPNALAGDTLRVPSERGAVDP